MRARRRPLRDGLGPGEARADRAQRLGPGAAALTREKVPPEPDGTIPLYSPYSWTVPGCVDGWFELHARYGRLPMAEVLAPDHRGGADGVPVPQVIAGGWASGERVFRDKPGFAEVFLPGGRAPGEGEVFANPALARTLELLATGGRDAFYRGPIAERLLAFSAQHGGFFAPRTSRATAATGSSRSRPATAASPSASCRRTARASPRCRC